MKIIEALKNLKLIEKRLNKNCQLINQYAAFVSTDNPTFDTVEKQQQEVDSLIQANNDLSQEYLKLKESIEYTNLVTKVSIGKEEFTISRLLTIKGSRFKAGAGDFKKKTYLMLNDANAVSRLREVQRTAIDTTNPPKVVRMYKEETKNKLAREWEEFLDSIDAKLEITNAEVELLTLAA